MTRSFLLLCAAGAVAVSGGMAAAEHADLLLIKDGTGNLVTGSYDFDGGTVTSTDRRVFGGEFDSFGTSAEPGFNALSSSNVPAGYQALGGNEDVSFSAKAFDIGGTISNLWYWDGVGGVDFSQVSDGTSLNISKAPSHIFSADLDGSGSDVAGFVIETTSADGFLHKHIDFALVNAGTPAGGLYLWAMSFEAEGQSTEPVFFVHGYGFHDEPQHEAAVDWVNANLVPAPGAMGALLGGLAFASRRRR